MDIMVEIGSKCGKCQAHVSEMYESGLSTALGAYALG
jgi:bacterioferritin-associated ferredoxin